MQVVAIIIFPVLAVAILFKLLRPIYGEDNSISISELKWWKRESNNRVDKIWFENDSSTPRFYK